MKQKRYNITIIASDLAVMINLKAMNQGLLSTIQKANVLTTSFLEHLLLLNMSAHRVR